MSDGVLQLGRADPQPVYVCVSTETHMVVGHKVFLFVCKCVS